MATSVGGCLGEPIEISLLMCNEMGSEIRLHIQVENGGEIARNVSAEEGGITCLEGETIEAHEGEAEVTAHVEQLDRTETAAVTFEEGGWLMVTAAYSGTRIEAYPYAPAVQ